MKKKFMFLCVLCLFLSIAFADTSGNVNNAMKEVDKAMKIAEKATKDAVSTSISVSKDVTMQKAYMGIYPKSLSMNDAKRLGYKNFYGILVGGVVANSPARKYRILKDDIIMYIGDEKIENLNTFNVVLEGFYVGDEVTIKVFRNGKEKDVNFVFGSRNVPQITKSNKSYSYSNTRRIREKSKFGGGWVFQYFKPDGFDEINNQVRALGFSKINQSGTFKDALMQNAIAFKGNAVNELMIGGIFAWASEDRRINHITKDGKSVVRGMEFYSGYGGITVDKRFALSKNIFVSFGGMLGWGSYQLDVSQTNGDYDWENLSEQIDDSSNNYVHLEKNYILFQPRVATIFRINKWLGIRAEAGYLLSYSYHDGWRNLLADDNYQVNNSEEKGTFDGLTVSIGPWFGF